MNVRPHVVGAALAAAILVLPGSARADWLLTPFAGVAFGGDAPGEKFTWGGSVGWMGAGIFGFEADFGYSPEFFDTSDDLDDFDDLDLFDAELNITTFMGNVIVGIPVGGDDGPIRPYATAGIGLMRTSVPGVDEFFEDVTSNDLGFNVGAGVMGFPSEHVGLRGDIRYFRNLSESESADFDFDIGGFHFWRATGGVTFRF